MNVLLDSSILIDVIKKKVELKEISYFVNPIVYAEILYGLLYIGKSEKQLQKFLSEGGIEVLTIGLDTAGVYAKLKLDLNKKGRSLADNDLLIAASCLEHGLALYTSNSKHFARIPDLKLVGS